jgi:Asp-tRNA(Asn)/Glu-tRNA(Gln) amidotransferase A subunit family amidase
MSADRYDLTPLKAPRTAGFALKLSTALIETRFPGTPIANKLLADVGVDRFRAAPCEEALAAVHPLFVAGPQTNNGAACPPPNHGSEATGGFQTAAEIAAEFIRGERTPTEVAEALIHRIQQTHKEDPSLGAVIAYKVDEILTSAAESTARYQAGAPLGPLDGVPVGVKDELDQRGYGTTVGTQFMGQTAAGEDATVVARLRAAGALLFGKLNMHEIGIGVTGINPHHGPARNPYDRGRVTGGSSSGSAAAVGAGLCPIAVGADGGGSIRIPASLCGVSGLKATFGRISEDGAAPLCWSVAHVGPIGATVGDVALGYAIMAGVDVKDPNTLYQPQPDLEGYGAPEIEGLRIGIYQPWFEDAEPSVVAACNAAVDALCAQGAQRVEVCLPDLGLLRTAHMVTIVSEMLTSMTSQLEADRTVFGHDVRLNLALAQRLTNADYVKAQRMRGRFFEHFQGALTRADIIVTPTTACTAPKIHKDALRTGDSDLETLDRIMRYAPAGNLTGLPGLTIPVGYDDDGLPIGLQIMGPAWSEGRLLGIGAALERLLTRHAPPMYVRL